MSFKMNILILLLITLVSGAAVGGEVLNDLLNYPYVDQSSVERHIEHEGLSLAGKKLAGYVVCSPDEPVGQTFTVGSDTHKLMRIYVSFCNYPNCWEEGEELTFSLYDSPEKSTKHYSRTIGYAEKWMKWDFAFDTCLPCKPLDQFYFEITHNGGGDGNIAVICFNKDTYNGGCAYLNGEPVKDTDLYFISVAKGEADTEANLQRFLSRFNMDYPPLSEAKKAYESGHYEEACKAILHHFETRTQPDELVPSFLDPDSFDWLRVRPIVTDSRYYKDGNKREKWIRMDRETTWREVWDGTDDYVRQNDVFSELGKAYYFTRDESYARKLNELVADFIDDNPSPLDGGADGGRWLPMHIGWRLGDAWSFFGTTRDAKEFTDDVKLAWIDYNCRLAEFVEKSPAHGNHENSCAESLLAFALRFPEFSESSSWRDQGFSRLMTNSLAFFNSDGGSIEPAMNYHGYAAGFLISGLEMAKEHNISVPASVVSRLEKVFEFYAYMLEPNGQAPSFGDTDAREFRPGEEAINHDREGKAVFGAEMFDRDDLLFIGTAGKRGTMPESNSYSFPESGYYVLRSGWGQFSGGDFEAARHMLVRTGTYGSHGHHDMNQLTLYAYGRPLIIDPGRATYGRPLQSTLMRAPSHNVLLVDDEEKMNTEARGTDTYFYTSPVLDFLNNKYPHLYPGVHHTRTVFFVRPDYYVVFDRASSDTIHDYGVNFWLAADNIAVDRAACSVRTMQPGGANLLVSSLGQCACDITTRKGTLRLKDEYLDNIPVVTFRKKSMQDADFITLLYPYPGFADAPNVSGYVSKGPKGSLVCVDHPFGKDIIYHASELSKSPLSCENTSSETVFHAKSGLVSIGKNGGVDSFAVTDCSRLTVGGNVLFSSEKPVSGVSVRYHSDHIEITTLHSPLSEIAINPLGRRQAIINGASCNISDVPFSTVTK